PLPPSALYTLSLHDALPILNASPPLRTPPLTHRVCLHLNNDGTTGRTHSLCAAAFRVPVCTAQPVRQTRPLPLRAVVRCTGSKKDRKSTRLNSSHVKISYAV